MNTLIKVCLLTFISFNCFGQESETINSTTEAPTENESAENKSAEQHKEEVSELPLFPGCDNDEEPYEKRKECADLKMIQYIYKHLKYPALARENNIQGRVVVQFIVEIDGTISNFEIVKDLGQGTGEAALAVLEQMNKDNIIWRPGYQNGIAKRVRYTIPMVLKLESKSDRKNNRKKRRDKRIKE